MIRELILEPYESKRIQNLFGTLNVHLKIIEEQLGISINGAGNTFSISGQSKATEQSVNLLRKLYQITAKKPIDKHIVLDEINHINSVQNAFFLNIKNKTIKARNKNQSTYLKEIQQNEIIFGIGPAGTGKTYLAVACAVYALWQQTVDKIILVRPAVEAGEKLGFLPGDLAEKVDPYLRPLYDALYDLLGREQVDKLLEKNTIEIAPLAFMRGRTLNHSFILLDEAQNTTSEQMKMFLTRFGFGSKAIITGDLTQIDLGNRIKSGLLDAVNMLQNIDGVHFSFFEPKDVVRHPLVQKIVQAYE